jgi:hypothetical protein
MDENIFFVKKKQFDFLQPNENYKEPTFNFILNF